MAEELGPTVEIHGVRRHAFPGPKRLATLESFPGLNTRKVEYLRRLGREATRQKLDAAYLRSLPEQEAFARLEELPGVGTFSSGLILLRGAGTPDVLPTTEPRLGRAVATAYNLKEPPTPQKLRGLAQPWRPYRTWVGLYLRVMLEEETGEIARQAKN